MNEDFFIYTHLGLGDAIICNGLVRNLVSRNPDTQHHIFCKKVYEHSISFMYRDVKNLYTLPLDGDDEVRSYLYQRRPKNLISVGFQNLDIFNKKFDQSFYDQFGVSFSERWDGFRVDRDLERENSLFEKLGLSKEGYVFIHDDAGRGFKIDKRNVINEELPIITPEDFSTENVFDWCTVLENAKELHFMDSCFKLIYDSIPGNQKMAFYHTYIRGNTNVNITNSRKKFIVIKDNPY